MADLIMLQDAVIAVCVLFAAAIGGAFVAELVMEFRRLSRGPVPAAAGGPWYPPTPDPAADTWTLPLGKTPAQIEAELSALAAMIPDRPA